MEPNSEVGCMFFFCRILGANIASSRDDLTTCHSVLHCLTDGHPLRTGPHRFFTFLIPSTSHLPEDIRTAPAIDIQEKPGADSGFQASFNIKDCLASLASTSQYQCGCNLFVAAVNSIPTKGAA